MRNFDTKTHNYKEIAHISGITVNSIKPDILGKFLKEIEAPYLYANVRDLIMAFPSDQEADILKLIKSLDAQALISLDRHALKTYGVMYSTDNIIIKINPKLKHILENL